MDLLSAMRNFSAVAESGSFSKAAKRLGIGNATMTQSIKNLEDHLGVRLLNRTTRHVKLTSEGEIYFERCRTTLMDIEDMNSTVSNMNAVPRGRLCVEVPAALGHAYIVPALPDFRRQYSDLEIVTLLNPGAGRLIEDGVDAAVQLGELESSSLIARQIFTAHHIACAAPSYVAACGEPQNPQELANHNCLGFFSSRTGRVAEWLFERDGMTVRHTPSGTFHFNSSEALIEVALQGQGIVYMLDLLVKPQIADGRLVQMLPGWSTQPRPLYLVHPDRRYVPAKVRAFGDFVSRLFNTAGMAPAQAAYSPTMPQRVFGHDSVFRGLAGGPTQ